MPEDKSPNMARARAIAKDMQDQERSAAAMARGVERQEKADQLGRNAQRIIAGQLPPTFEHMLTLTEYHGQVSDDPYNEAGDLMDLARLCWEQLTEARRAKVAKKFIAQMEESIGIDPEEGDLDQCTWATPDRRCLLPAGHNGGHDLAPEAPEDGQGPHTITDAMRDAEEDR